MMSPGLFAAGGTGEFFSLTPAEVAKVVAVAVDETKGRVPVLAGTGYGTAIAQRDRNRRRKGRRRRPAAAAALSHAFRAGRASPPTSRPSVRRPNSASSSTTATTLILQPDTLARLCERCPNLVGYKDGIGDIELMTRVYSKLGDRLTYVGGLPTAETFALPYLDMGVTTYSSAVFNFVPEFATAFYAAVRTLRPCRDPRRPEGFHPAPDRDPQPQEGLCGLDHQGRHEGDRPRFRSCAAADRSDRAMRKSAW